MNRHLLDNVVLVGWKVCVGHERGDGNVRIDYSKQGTVNESSIEGLGKRLRNVTVYFIEQTVTKYVHRIGIHRTI